MITCPPPFNKGGKKTAVFHKAESTPKSLSPLLKGDVAAGDRGIPFEESLHQRYVPVRLPEGELSQRDKRGRHGPLTREARVLCTSYTQEIRPAWHLTKPRKQYKIAIDI